MSLEEWRWKYPENPYGFRCLICLAEDGTVVTHYAAQVVRLCWDERLLWGLHLTDSFSHPSYRWAVGGKCGLFVRTGWLFLKTYLEEIPLPIEERLPVSEPLAQFHYGFPGERHFRLGVKLLRYRRHNPGILYLKKDAPVQGRGPLFLKIRGETFKTFKAFKDLDSLFSEFQKRYRPFCVIRDSRYLKWRFGSPQKKYLIFYTKTFLRKRIKAWIILCLKNDKALILDFLAQDEEAMEELLRGLGKEIKKPLEVWLAGNHPLKGAFLASGFKEEQEPLGIIPNTRCDFLGNHPAPEEADQFFFTMADADLF